MKKRFLPIMIITALVMFPIYDTRLSNDTGRFRGRILPFANKKGKGRLT